MFYDWKHHFYPFGSDGAIKIFSQTMTEIINQLMNHGGVCRSAPGFAGSANNYHALIERSDINMDKNYSDNISQAEWTENNKDQKTESNHNADKKLSRQFFLFGQKGIYHQIEFCQINKKNLVETKACTVRLLFCCQQ